MFISQVALAHDYFECVITVLKKQITINIRGPVNAQLCVIDALEADFDALQILE